jgi:hypothetical protein
VNVGSDATSANPSARTDATVGAVAADEDRSVIELYLSVNVTTPPDSVRAHPSGTFTVYTPSVGANGMNTWLSGMSPGSTTSGAFGSTAAGSVVGAASAVVDALGTVRAGAVVDVVGASPAVVVVALLTVEMATVSVAGTVGGEELLELLHAEASSTTASPAAARADVVRMTNSLLGSSLWS